MTLPEQPAATKTRLGLEPGRLLVGAAGRLSPEKGFNPLIRAVHRLLQAGRVSPEPQPPEEP